MGEENQPKLIVPDSIEPYIGYKTLQVDQSGTLKSLAFEYLWTPDERAVAYCGRGIVHDVPAEGCYCGFYAADWGRGTASTYLGPARVIVEVAVWGKVVRHTWGARGQYAYPQKIVTAFAVPDYRLKAVSKKYGIPVELEVWSLASGSSVPF